MNHATTYHGYNKVTPRTKAKAVTPSVRRVCVQDATHKGHRRNPKGQAKSRANSHVANAFLRTSFLPRLQEAETVQACEDNPKMERDFYQSLSHLAKCYGIQPMQTQSYGYPYNIALAIADVKEQLQNKIENWQEVRLIQHEGSTFFAKEERYDTGTTLYYIPVAPLYLMLKDPKRRRTALLLLSVCSYLYRIADIPYYRQENSYLYWMYEMLLEWKMEAEEEEEADHEFLTEYREAEYIGGVMEKKLCNPNNLSWFKNRLTSFRSRDGFDKECWQLAQKIFELYGEYPTTPIHRKFSPARNEEDESGDCGIGLEKYISFFASGNGVLSDFLIETVNHDLQEYTMIDEPTIYRPFDGRKMEDDNFDFEQRLFTLIDELSTLLNDYQTLL